MVKLKKKLNWNNVTLFQFKRLQELLTIEDESEKLLAIAELILGEDVLNLPLKDFTEKTSELSFLKEDVPTFTPPKKIEVNNRKYKVDCLLGNITTAQYLDYTNHLKSKEYNKILSPFLIPDGHTYNDGYDMQQVFNDIDDLPIPIVLSIAFFFSRQFHKFTTIFQSYSAKRIKKMNLPKEQKEAMLKMNQSLKGLESYLIS